MAVSVITSAAETLRVRAEELGAVRKREAIEWRRQRALVVTDRAATYATTIEMNGAVELAEAEYQIALANLKQARED